MTSQPSSRLLVLLFLCCAPLHTNAQRTRRARTPPKPHAYFTAGQNALNIPFRFANNLILVEARVNDSAPLRFIFDTGASNTVLDARTAAALHLRPTGRDSGNGSAARISVALTRGVRVRLPGVEVRNLTLALFPLTEAFSPAFGQQIDGVIGNDIIKQFVVEMDYAAQQINLYAPDSYHYAGAGAVLPMTIAGELPFVLLSLTLPNGTTETGKFELDSGSTGALLLNTPFVRRHGLLRAVTPTRATNVGGAGGSAAARIGRLPRITLGPFQFTNTIVRLAQATRGDDASARYDGTIGGDILRRFKFIFDFSRRQAIFEPNAALSEPFEVDMSGLERVGDGADYKTLLIDDVDADSPATEAGIKGGETLLAIDGRPVAEFTLEEIHQLLRQAGRAYLLTLKRGEQTIQIKLKLRRMI
ncbi:MAG TPA: aspartyl protease family protein [Pyrinomonadaceae bacterium]|jgi:hypothetical protein